MKLNFHVLQIVPLKTLMIPLFVCLQAALCLLEHHLALHLGFGTGGGDVFWIVYLSGFCCCAQSTCPWCTPAAVQSKALLELGFGLLSHILLAVHHRHRGSLPV